MNFLGTGGGKAHQEDRVSEKTPPPRGPAARAMHFFMKCSKVFLSNQAMSEKAPRPSWGQSE